jgi:hypothetical protein
VAHLRDLTALEWLSLEDTKVSDAGLVHLARLSRLQTLSLRMTDVSDAGLPHLKPLSGLKKLSLELTWVSNDAGRALRQAMPGTRFWWYGWGAGQSQARAIMLNEKAANSKRRR